MELTSHSWTRSAANSGATHGSWTISRWSASRLIRALVLGALAATAVTSVSGAGAAGAAWTAPAAPGPLTAVVVRASAGHLAQAEATARQSGGSSNSLATHSTASSSWASSSWASSSRASSSWTDAAWQSSFWG